MDAVRHAEEATRLRVVDVSAQKCGWDITSYPPPWTASSRTRHIEVKGRVKGAGTVTVHRNEMLYAFNQGDKFLLAIVLVGEDDTVDGPHYLRNPFDARTRLGRVVDQLRPATCSNGPRGTRDHPIISPQKLIEVALPLDAINAAAAREKAIRHGHPSTFHLWWARRPLAAARAVIFAQLVHDPEDPGDASTGKEPNKKVRGHWTKAAKLFKIIEDLVLWENTTNEEVLERARAEIRRWREMCELNKDHPQAAELFDPEKLPGLHDPFAGGGTIPLEAQRLGLEAFASDLNPVAVLINKAMIEIPPKFAGKPPVHSDANKPLMTWSGAAGLAEDVRSYGAWMQEEAQKRIGHLYPPIEIRKTIVERTPRPKAI